MWCVWQGIQTLGNSLHSHESPHGRETIQVLCEKRFSDFSTFQQHKAYIHSNRRPYRCAYCGMLYKTKDKLKRHVRCHTGEMLYSCHHCAEGFGRLCQLKAHLLKSHNEGTWFTCDICQKKFVYKSDLKTHTLHHEGLKPYVCSECPKCFYTARALKSHQPVHSDFRPFCCGSCGKTFKRQTSVPRHFKKCSETLGFDFKKSLCDSLVYSNV